MMRVVFVCTGNICRSPMAEAIADSLLAGRGVDDVMVSSAGTATDEGLRATDLARRVVGEHGLTLEHHRSTQATAELFESADLILVMTSRHLEQVRALGAGDRAQLLTAYATGGADGQSIADPFGADIGAYRATFEQINAAVGGAVERLLAEKAAAGDAVP